MRDIITIPFTSEESIVIASDNSGGIGLKAEDFVQVPYEMVAYYAFRVAVMECMAAGAKPFAVTLQNFCGEEAWQALTNGIAKGCSELDMSEVPLTGSTESNFSLDQSAVGLTVMGRMKPTHYTGAIKFSNQLNIAVIGTPLVGQELVEREEEAVPLSLFKQICQMNDVVLLPVGSKGILIELNTLFSNRTFRDDSVSSELDLHQSSGPATCFIAVFGHEKQEELQAATGRFFHKLIY
ncbi:AIR synthase related protein [Cytobacillus purgationiresistens]|uniref:PurM-like N-terminal domain-containing protein n=1 Tax=Cytobacillus purgationiresistens TaxID=863449 RepID=A0ABU0AR56_9BACI|nr:AIR synthase related protein [Cytobacillus purgationiresistens]MDQ0273231.1 hypothetical protein [Cytobacillus purgationiresistens]